MGLVKVLKLVLDKDGHGMQALIPLPALAERFVRLPTEAPQPGANAPAAIRFVLLEDVVWLFLHRLFLGFREVGRGK